MAKRLTLLTLAGPAVVDVPDDFLVLDSNYRFVNPENAMYVLTQTQMTAHDYMPYAAGGLPLSIFISSGSVVRVSSVTDVPDVEKQDLQLISGEDPTHGICVCGITAGCGTELSYARVYVLEEHS